MNKFAISSGGVGDALLRSAAAMKSAGNTIDETVALVAAANTVVQNPETVGTTLKTISMYLRAAKTEAEAAGESTEGMASSVSELRQEILDLTGRRVDIQIDENTFKSTYQIMAELASVWKDINDTSKANILEMIGGKRNANVVAALLENFTVAEKALDDAAGSAGSALAENEKYLDSIQGKINILKANFESLSQTVINSELIKGVVGLLSIVLKILDSLISVINMLGGEYTLFIAALLTGVTVIPKLITKLTALIAPLSGLFIGVRSLRGVFDAAIVGVINFTTGVATAGEMLQATVPIILAVSAAISVIITIIKQVNKSIEESIDAAKNAAKTYNDTAKSLEEYKEKAAELRKEIDKGNLSEEEAYNKRKELFSIQNSLIDMFGNEAKGINLVTGAIEDQIDALERLSKQKWEAYEREHFTAIKRAKEVFTAADTDVLGGEGVSVSYSNDLAPGTVQTELDFWQGFINKIKSIIPENLLQTDIDRNWQNIKFGIKPGTVSAYDALDYYNQIYDAFAEYAKEIYPDSYETVYEKTFANLSRIIGSITQAIKDNEEAFKIHAEGTLENDQKYSAVWAEVQTAYDNYREAVLEGEDDAAMSALKNMDAAREKFFKIDGLEADIRNYAEDFFEDFDKAVADHEVKLNIQADSSEIANSIKSSLGYFVNSDGVVDLYSILNEGIKLGAENGTFTSLSPAQAAYVSLSKKAKEYNTDVETLIRTLAELETIQVKLGDTKDDRVEIEKISRDYLKDIQELQTAAKEFRETGKISAKTYNEVFAGNEKLKSLINTADGKFKLDSEGLNSYLDTLQDETMRSLAEVGATDADITHIHALTEGIRLLIEKESEALESLKNLQSVLDEVKGGRLYSTSEMDELLLKYPALEGYITETAKGYKIEETALKELIEAEKSHIRLKAAEVAGVGDARSELLGQLGTSTVVDRIDSIFSEYGEAINSIEDFEAKASEVYGSNLKSDDPRVREYIQTWLNAMDTVETYFDLIAEYGTDGYKDGYNPSGNEKDTETEFEKQYKLHKHYLAMEQETEAEYLRWLEGAYAEAYASGEIKEGDHYQYLEEIYEGRKNEFQKSLDDREHQIEMMQKSGLGADSIIPVYQSLMNDVETQKQKYLDAGLDKDSEYIKELESLWWGYRDSLFEVYNSDLENRLAVQDHAVSLIENADINNERSGEIIDIYKGNQEEIHRLADTYRSLGLSEEHEYIRKLQELWWENQKKIDDIRSSDFERKLEKSKYGIETLKINNADSSEIIKSWEIILAEVESEINYYTSLGYDKSSEVIRNLLEKANGAKDGIIEAIEAVVTRANELVEGFENTYSTLTAAAREYAENGFMSVDTLQSILGLSPKYLAMLQDENGQLVVNEEAIQAIIKARTEEMAAETALAYAKQILIAAEDGDINKLTSLAAVTEKAGNATWDMAYATLALAKAVGDSKGIDVSYFDNAYKNLDTMRSLSNLATDSISSFYKTLDSSYISQKDALDKILSLTEDLIKHELEKQKEALEDQKSDYADIINQKKEMIRLAKEQEDREKSVAEKLEEMAKLQAKIAQLSLDDSREAQAERRSLEEELSNLQKELTNEQSDHAYDVQVEVLDKELEAYEKEKDAEIDALEDTLSSAEKLYQAALERIENGWDTLYTELLDWNYNYGSTLQSDLENAWDGALAAAKRYGSFVSAMSGTKDHSTIGESHIVLDGNADPSYSSQTFASVIVDKMKTNAEAWHSVGGAKQKELADENAMLAEILASNLGANIKRTADGVWWIDGERLFEKYHSGGIVGKRASLKENEVLAILEDGETVLDERKEEGLFKIIDFVNSLSEKLGYSLDPEKIRNVFGGTSRISSNSSYADDVRRESERVLEKSFNGERSFVIESIDVDVPIQVIKELNEDEIKKFSDTIASVSAEHIKRAFTKRGVTKPVSMF